MVGVANKGLSGALEEISIRGLGVIENATVPLKPGLNVLTGETGAGKTMVITALSLVLGGKSDPDLIRTGAERLSVSGRFALPQNCSARLIELLEEHQPELEEGSLLLSRSVHRDGKSRAQLSGSATTASTLAAFGGELIEIHGQHGALTLGKERRQRELLDAFGASDSTKLLDSFRESLTAFREVSERIDQLRSALRDRDREISELRDLAGEFGRIKPRTNELAEISATISRMESVEELRIAASGALDALDGEDGGASLGLAAARRFLASGRAKDEALADMANRFEDALVEINELGRELSAYLSNLDSDPRSLEELLNRRALLHGYAKRFGSGDDRNAAYESAVALGENANSRISDLSGGEDRIVELEREARNLFEKVESKAKELSKFRSSSARVLSDRVIAELEQLSMPHSRFEIEVNFTPPTPASPPGAFGCDEVAMKFSAHKDGELLPIGKSASGGELSRLMLALEVAIAGKRPVGTYLFDEVDAGIGGKTALEVGRRLKSLSESAQVIVVTHLPQVAIWADNHLRVAKDLSGSITESSIEVISGDDREIEIARMLSGLSDSEHAQEHARELLDLGRSSFN